MKCLRNTTSLCRCDYCRRTEQVDQYKWACGCEVIVDDTGDVATKRCNEHKKKFPHRLDEKPKREK